MGLLWDYSIPVGLLWAIHGASMGLLQPHGTPMVLTVFALEFYETAMGLPYDHDGTSTGLRGGSHGIRWDSHEI